MKSKFSASLALLAFGVFSAGFWNPRVARAADTYVPFEGEKTTWHDGFERYDYVMEEETFAITPFKRPDTEKFAVGNPHTLPIEDRYQQLGGRITVMIKDGHAHHPHSLRNSKPIADWIVEHTQPAAGARLDFADEKFIKSYYYSLESTNLWLKEEKTYANCRGPGFVECYDRYDEKTSSQWGLTGLAVIVPKTVAPGKPWVFRADAITRDAVIDQALLARGFHIVTPPLTAQSGAVRTQWNNAYQLMTDHGYAKKPVLEGTGTAAGEAYAWAIENPSKVACIVGRNPALRSLMSKVSPLENLGPLAKAGVPLLHVCDKTDPWFNEHTRVVEQRYQELGGQLTVIINENDGRHPLAAADQTRVVDFIVEKTK